MFVLIKGWCREIWYLNFTVYKRHHSLHTPHLIEVFTKKEEEIGKGRCITETKINKMFQQIFCCILRKTSLFLQIFQRPNVQKRKL